MRRVRAPVVVPALRRILSSITGEVEEGLTPTFRSLKMGEKFPFGISDDEYKRLNYDIEESRKNANKEWDFSNADKPRTKHDILDDFYNKLNARFTFKTFQDSQEVLWYDGQQGFYRFNGEVKIKAELEKIFEEELRAGKVNVSNRLTEHDREEIVKRIKWNTVIERERFEKQDTSIINLQNGLFDITTKKLSPHTPDFLTTMQLPLRFDPNAKWSQVLRFLKQVQNREGVIILLKMFGYILMINSVKYQKAFFFAGRGDNGKSVAIDLAEAFVGEENCSSVKLHDLRNDKYMRAQMYGKIINTYADNPSTSLQDVGLFKALVSGDRITGQHKYGKLFTFRNCSKLIFSGNTIPLSEGEDELAYFKRWVILPFDAIISDEKQDRDLIKKLTTPENLSALFNLASVGLDLLKREGFEKVPIQVIREEYNRQSVSLTSFVNSKCSINLSKTEYYMVKDDFNEAYWRDYKERKMGGEDLEEPLSPGQIEIELSKYNVFAKRIIKDKVKRPCYNGIITLEEANKRNQEILERQKQSKLTED
jgi:P4 family phage/plasmid primase-like protien